MATYSLEGRVDAEFIASIATGIDSADWATGALVVVYHAKEKWDLDEGELRVQVNAIALDETEPEVVFRGPTVANLVLTHLSPAPGLDVLPFASAPGDLLEVRLVWRPYVEEPQPDRTVTLSIFLLGRRHVLTRLEAEEGAVV